MLIFDAHLDISWNALSYDRDQTLPIDKLRARDSVMTGVSRGKCTVSLPEMRRSGVGLCLATVLARSRPEFVPVKTHERTSIDFANQHIAHSTAIGQLSYYKVMEELGQMTMIRTQSDLARSAKTWRDGASAATSNAPIGYILSMEGCDPILSPADAQRWFDLGLRTACLAHYGQSAYSMGTGGDGPLTPAGRELVKAFSRLGIILDVVHTADTALMQAMEIYDKPVYVSHGNARALVPGDRQISDEQIKAIAARGGIIGAVFDCWMLMPGYKSGVTPNATVSLDTVAKHIDHVCQLTGSAKHAAIGSDLDGGFGTEQSPHDLNTIADLQKLSGLLTARGYSQQDIELILHGNWLRFFADNLPA
jgi:membrane dipeptidase